MGKKSAAKKSDGEQPKVEKKQKPSSSGDKSKVENSEVEKKQKQPNSIEKPKVENSEVEKLRAELAEKRKNLGLFKSPFRTLRLSMWWIVDFCVGTTKTVLKSPLTWFLVVPLAVGWYALKFHLALELFEPPVCGDKAAGLLWNVELAFKEAMWWLILGILSSVGFGTGLHSGMMFLFPHVMQVVTAAEACHTTNGLIAWYQHPCKLDCHTTYGPKDDSTVTFWRLWCAVTIPCMLWGVGTAMGELPPYMISKAARLAGSKDEDFESELEDARTKTDVFSKMKMWTIDFTEKHGFVGVLLLASWPNAAFDMCGMCCGYVLMPFWTFFIATAIGKGLVKTNGQAAVFVNLFGSDFFQLMLGAIDKVNGAIGSAIGKDLGLRTVAENGRAKLVRTFEFQSRFPAEKLFADTQSLDLIALEKVYAKQDKAQEIAKRVLQEWDKNADGSISLEELSAAASRTDRKVSLSSLDPGAPTSMFKMLWELFIVGLVLFFVFSVIDQLAKSKQAELDEKHVEKKQKGQKKSK